MPTESLILRRSYPVPVTFADLRIAGSGFWRRPSTKVAEKISGNVYQPAAKDGRRIFQANLKEATGAIDEVYAVIDGREVRVAVIDTVGKTIVMHGGTNIDGALNDLLIKADEAGYWQRPHEIVHVLSERPVSFEAVERAVNVGWCAKGGAA